MAIDQTYFRDFFIVILYALMFLIIYFLIDQIKTKSRERLLEVFDQNLLTTLSVVNN